MEIEYNAENMEEDVTDVGNATTSVPMSINPPASTPYFVLGETAEIQSDYPTASQTMPVSMALPPPFVTSATRANLGLFDTSFFTIPRSGEAQGFVIRTLPECADATVHSQSPRRSILCRLFWMPRQFFCTCEFPPADFHRQTVPLIAQTGWKRRTQCTGLHTHNPQ